MIEIIVLRKDDNIRGYEVSGHSGFDEPGKDIVCAAVSALAQTGIYSLVKLTSLELEQKIELGYLRCYVSGDLGTAEQKKEVELIINTVLVGVYETARTYPEMIKIIDEGGMYQCL